MPTTNRTQIQLLPIQSIKHSHASASLPKHRSSKRSQCMSRIELHQCETPLLERVWKTAHRISDSENKTVALTTSPEAEYVLRWLDVKFAPDQLTQLYNLVWIYGIAANCQAMNLRELRRLGELACAGGADEIARVLSDARADKLVDQRLRFVVPR